jgi:hypothetical protein
MHPFCGVLKKMEYMPQLDELIFVNVRKNHEILSRGVQLELKVEETEVGIELIFEPCRADA